MGYQLKWGKMKVLISPRAGDALTGWKEIFTPVKDSFVLSTEDGEKLEAFIEGGERIAVRQDSSKFAFEFETFIAEGLPRPIEDIDGVVLDEYGIAMIPENDKLEGLLMKRTAVSVQHSLSSKDGHKVKYKFEALKPTEGRMLEPLLPAVPSSLLFTSAADSNGKAVTMTAEGAVKATSDQAWVTVSVSGKIITVKVAANTGAKRTASITVNADDKIAIVMVTQAGA